MRNAEIEYLLKYILSIFRLVAKGGETEKNQRLIASDTIASRVHLMVSAV